MELENLAFFAQYILDTVWDRSMVTVWLQKVISTWANHVNFYGLEWSWRSRRAQFWGRIHVLVTTFGMVTLVGEWLDSLGSSTTPSERSSVPALTICGGGDLPTYARILWPTATKFCRMTELWEGRLFPGSMVPRTYRRGHRWPKTSPYFL